MVNAGPPIYVVATLLGQTQVKPTQRYAYPSNATLFAAVDVAASAASAVTGDRLSPSA